MDKGGGEAGWNAIVYFGCPAQGSPRGKGGLGEAGV